MIKGLGEKSMRFLKALTGIAGCTGLVLAAALHSAAQTQTPSKALLVLEQNGTQLAIIDPMSLKIVAKLAYISNYELR
jgi:hypothetical protein